MVLRATPQKREEKERVRLALLRAALSLGAEHGFASLGLREVARAASIAPTSFYRHFADMTELGRAVVEECVRPMLHPLVSAARELPPDPRALSRELVELVLAAVAGDAELARFLIAERVGASEVLRKQLAGQLAVLGDALRTRAAVDHAEQVGYAIDAAIALLLEAFALGLELAAAERARLHACIGEPLSLLLDAALSGARRHG